MASSVYRGKLSRFHFKTETESSHLNFVFEIKVWTMDNVQNSDSYINFISSQSYR
jgi:hypothetical protein